MDSKKATTKADCPNISTFGVLEYFGIRPELQAGERWRGLPRVTYIGLGFCEDYAPIQLKRYVDAGGIIEVGMVGKMMPPRGGILTALNAQGKPVTLGEIVEQIVDEDRIRAANGEHQIDRHFFFNTKIHEAALPGEIGKLTSELLLGREFVFAVEPVDPTAGAAGALTRRCVRVSFERIEDEEGQTSDQKEGYQDGIED